MPETAVSRLPRFVATLQGLSDEDRKTELQRPHPDYVANAPAWQILLDAFEGQGGFLDGSYLWPYPREESASFTERQVMARYHNYVETLVELYVRQLFTQSVKRSSNDPAYVEWSLDVDLAGTSLNEYMKRVAALALVGGHAGTLVDKTSDEPSGPTRADEAARVFLTTFANVAIADWRHARHRLTGVKLIEAAPPTSIAAPVDTRQQWLLWDEEGWARFDAEGRLIGGDLTIALGFVPFVILRPKPSQVSQMLGRPLVGNANVIRALYNRGSEEDQVLRDQAFSVLTVTVPIEGNVEEVKAQIGSTVGTARALVAKGTIDYKTPSMEVPATIRDNEARLVDEIYRAAHVRYRRDSLAAESAEALRIQHTELNEMLQGFGQALSAAERAIARAYYAWTEPTPEAAQAAFDAAECVAEYPDEFFLDALITDLEAWAAAIEMDLGLTMAHRIKKRAVRRVEDDIPPDELAVIDAEIDAQTEAPRPMPGDTGDPELDAFRRAERRGMEEE